jgi:hypothetical protein
MDFTPRQILNILGNQLKEADMGGVGHVTENINEIHTIV